MKTYTDYHNILVQALAGHLDVKETQVMTVWFAKEIQNSKGMFIVAGGDKAYYEVTYNGEKDEFYIDTYYQGHHSKYENTKK